MGSSYYKNFLFKSKQDVKVDPVLRPALQQKYLIHLKPANISIFPFIPIQFHALCQEMSLASKTIINSGNCAPITFRPCLLNHSQDINKMSCYTGVSCWPEHLVFLLIFVANTIWKTGLKSIGKSWEENSLPISFWGSLTILTKLLLINASTDI